jgi:hypothetical protein
LQFTLNLGTPSRAKPTREPGKTLTPTLQPARRRRPARDTGTAQPHQYLATLPLKEVAPLNQEMKKNKQLPGNNNKA